MPVIRVVMTSKNTINLGRNPPLLGGFSANLLEDKPLLARPDQSFWTTRSNKILVQNYAASVKRSQ